jgi:diguanylate cyclase (GGDEF)-like protein/PAS domain S-box-containing protein
MTWRPVLGKGPWHRWRFTLEAKLVLRLIPPLLVLMFSLSWYQNRQEDELRRQDLRRSMENFASLQAMVVAPLLWNLDMFTLRALFEGYAGVGDLQGAFLYDHDGTLLIKAGTGAATDQPQVRRRILMAGKGAQGELGEFVVTFSEARIEAEGVRRQKAQMTAFGAITGLIVLCTVIALRLVVSRPLEQLLMSLERASEDRVREPVAWRSKDELGRVVETYNRLLARETAAEESLRESQARFRELVEQAPEAILVFDSSAAGIVVEANAQAEKLWGCRRAELLGRRPGDLYAEDTEQPDGRAVADSLAEHERQAMDGEACVFDRVVKDSAGVEKICEVRLARLPDASRSLVRASFIDVTERKAAQVRIEHLASHDPLTDLPNRLLFQDRFKIAQLQAVRAGLKVGLFFLDLDNFKSVNDLLGHTVGDALLKEIAKRLSRCVRESDTLARQGGDEFLLLAASQPSIEALAAVAAKIMEQMQEPFVVEATEVTTSASIGIACFPDDGGDFETLLRRADTALYRAKDAGRNAYRFFDEQMQADVAEHQKIRNGLRRGLEQMSFRLHYQPQVDLVSGAIVGVEALLRWQDPELGPVSPARFIPIAEDSGLIVPIGEWVLTEACRQAVDWHRQGFSGLVVAVNLSAVQFRRGNLERTIVTSLDQSGLDPSCLDIELTESVLLTDTETVLADVAHLKRLGIKLSIDDFGTGYSSLSYLKRFRVDKLKIDQSFVRDILDDPNDAAIVRAIVQMAKSLHLRTIAEGVESRGVLELLSDFGCDEVQGYHLARPMPGNAIAQFIADHGNRRPC